MAIRYVLNGPGVDIAWTLDDGRLEIDLLTSDTVPQAEPVRLGRFTTEAPGSVARDLHDLADRTPPGAEAPVTGRAVGRWIATDDEPLRAVTGDLLSASLEASLREAAGRSLATPVAAVEVAATPQSLVVTALGTEPVPVLFFEDTDLGFWLRVYREDDGERTYVPFETIRALAESGDLPSGEVSLEPGRSTDLPMPAAPPPCAGGFWFWRSDGVVRRPMIGRWTLTH